MSMQQKADYIYAIKGQIKVAIEGKKGAPVTGDFSTYPAEISGLPGGGGGGELSVPSYRPVDIPNGGTISGVAIKSPTNVIVESGGSAVSNTVSGGATLVQLVGSVESGNVTAGGNIVNSSGAVSAGSVIAANRTFTSGQYTLECTINAYITYREAASWMDSIIGGGLAVSSGGTVNYTTVSGHEVPIYVSNGAVAMHTTVYGSARLLVESSGVADYTIVGSLGECRAGGEWDWEDRPYGVISHATVRSGGSLYIGSMGTADSATVSQGGRMLIFTSGVANHTVISSGGVCSVGGSMAWWWWNGAVGQPDGTATSPTVSSGGSLVVSSGGSALNVYSATGAIVTSAAGAYITYRQNP